MPTPVAPLENPASEPTTEAPAVIAEATEEADKPTETSEAAPVVAAAA